MVLFIQNFKMFLEENPFFIIALSVAFYGAAAVFAGFWFQRKQNPAIVAGIVYEIIALPHLCLQGIIFWDLLHFLTSGNHISILVIIGHTLATLLVVPFAFSLRIPKHKSRTPCHVLGLFVIGGFVISMVAFIIYACTPQITF